MGIEELADAYEGLESAFPDDDARERYRTAMLARSAPQADFLVPRMREGERVLEVGCGNGRLLIELAQRGRIESALGLDLAASRIAFASEWAADAGVAVQLDFDTADALVHPLDEAPYSTALCVTGAFGYFEPALPGSAEQLASRLHAALAPGGLLCLELYPHPRERALVEAAGGSLRTWKELDEDDPWRFYLSDFRLDGATLTHAKTFVHRHTGEIDSGRREALHLYSPDEVTGLLQSAGFGTVELFEGWGDQAYAGGPVMVVTARA